MEKGQAYFLKEDVNTKSFFAGVVERVEDGKIYIYDNSNPSGYRRHIYKIEDVKKWVSMGVASFRKASFNQSEYRGE